MLRAIRPVSGAQSFLRPAERRDADRVRALLSAAGLPADLSAEWFPVQAIVALRRGEVVGVAAFERAEDHALLRSVAVEGAERGSGLGGALVADRLAAARAAGCRSVHLLTTDATGYFARLGFVAVPRDAVPSPLLGLSQFAALCPASATCMRLA